MRLTNYLTLILAGILAVFLPGTSLHAQKMTMDGMLTMHLRDMGPIIENDQVKGYYTFYKVDKASKGDNNYLLRILDENLKEAAQKKIVAAKHIRLQECAYNGKSLMFKLFDPKEKELAFWKYSTKGDLLSKKTIKLDSRKEMMEYEMPNQGEDEIRGANLFTIPGHGFVNYRVKDNKDMGYSINFFPDGDSTSSKPWTFNSNVESKDHELATFLASSDKLLVSSVMKKANRMTTDLEYYMLGVDLKTGKKLFERKLEDKKYALQPISGYYNQKTGRTVIFGQYYNADEKILKAKSVGLFSLELDETGKDVSRKFVTWAKDVSKFLPVSAKGKIEDVGFLYFQKFFTDASGKVYAVAETYRMAADAAGIALAVLGGGGNVQKIVIEDLMIFEFSPDYTLTDVKTFDKGKTNFALGSGVAVGSTTMYGHYVHMYGGFDYSYTQMHPDRSVFSVCYKDYERRKGAKDSWVFGAVSHTGDEFTVDKINLETEASVIGTFAAKPGYVLVTEYYRKKKTMDMHLEKINY